MLRSPPCYLVSFPFFFLCFVFTVLWKGWGGEAKDGGWEVLNGGEGVGARAGAGGPRTRTSSEVSSYSTHQSDTLHERSKSLVYTISYLAQTHWGEGEERETLVVIFAERLTFTYVANDEQWMWGVCVLLEKNTIASNIFETGPDKKQNKTTTTKHPKTAITINKKCSV